MLKKGNRLSILVILFQVVMFFSFGLCSWESQCEAGWFVALFWQKLSLSLIWSFLDTVL